MTKLFFSLQTHTAKAAPSSCNSDSVAEDFIVPQIFEEGGGGQMFWKELKGAGGVDLVIHGCFEKRKHHL